MSALSLLCLSLLVVSMRSVSSHQVLSREQLTEEFEKLAKKVQQLQDRDNLTDDIEKLGLTLGETLSRSLTEGLEKLGEKLASNTCIANLPVTRNVSEPKSCVEVREYDSSSGIHTLTVNNRPVTVFCDQNTDGGGWTVIQRRQDGSVDFYRDWIQYRHGFGDLNGEFWLGLDNIHHLTTADKQTLRVDLHDFSGNSAYAEYTNFNISGAGNLYRLHYSSYRGTADDAFATQQINRPFSTKDKDHDTYSGNCAAVYHGAWWYGSCFDSNLNGRYRHSAVDTADGIVWYEWKNKFVTLKHVEMKLRPAL